LAGTLKTRFILALLAWREFYHAKMIVPSSATPTVGVAMSSAIGFREFSEDEYRKFIRTLSDDELIKAGKRLRMSCGDVVPPIPSGFDKQLKICREEYRQDIREQVARSDQTEHSPSDDALGIWK
jgi:hypothetical protein